MWRRKRDARFQFLNSIAAHVTKISLPVFIFYGEMVINVRQPSQISINALTLGAYAPILATKIKVAKIN